MGALKARILGLSGLPTGIENAMENALKKNNVRYLPQHSYKIGIMDFYLPDAKIALFIDGTIWHVDPMIYKEHDRLFFSRKISRNREQEKMTAKEVWVKDARHHAYLESGGFIVIRFWERVKEISISAKNSSGHAHGDEAIHKKSYKINLGQIL